MVIRHVDGGAPPPNLPFPYLNLIWPSARRSGYCCVPFFRARGEPDPTAGGRGRAPLLLYGSAPPLAAAQTYRSPFASAPPGPSAFPPGTDPNLVACFQFADADRTGFIDDKALQRALSSYDHRFSLRTVHLIICLFTSSNNVRRIIGPKEFISVFYSLQRWRAIFERFDRDRSGRIGITELRDALVSLKFYVSHSALDLLVSKFDNSGGKNKSINYDHFIECILIVKGLNEKFKENLNEKLEEKDKMDTASATFTFESFMMSVLPFLIA